MELGLSTTLLPGDPRLVDHIVGEVKSQGIFDQFRKECIADVDTKPAYQNLRTRVEGSVNSFLDKQIWKPDLNKNQLRETLRKHIHDAPYLDAGVERIVDQVVNPKVYSVFMPQIEDVVYKFLGIERPKSKEKSGACGLKDLLPKDLDPVSPESDKNSLKDVSLESIDAIDDLESKKEERSDKLHKDEVIKSNEQFKEKDKTSENGHISCDEKVVEEVSDKAALNNGNLNVSDKSDDKMEEEEEDSPMFEPIDIMNLNESNISNDSHLSGISELTSHQSRSPDFSNELSQDNFDYSNQDSQLSKVSSDSRLSIATEFGLSNHASTPVHDIVKEEVNKDGKFETKGSKDNFKAIRELESCKNKNNKPYDVKKNKDSTQELKEKDSKTLKGINPSSSDVTDSGTKDKYDSKSSKEVKGKDSENMKLKSNKEKDPRRDSKDLKDSKSKEKDSDKKKQSSHSSSSSSSSTSSKHDKYSNKNKVKVETKPKEGVDRNKDNTDFIKDDSISKTCKEEEKVTKEVEKKENTTSKEAKDLKDLYKEKIRELREKKELTEKEKLNKDNIKSNKDSREKKDLGKDKKIKDKRDKEKEHKSSSSSDHHENKNKLTITDKSVESKDKKVESRNKVKRDDKHMLKDKERRSSLSSSSKFEKNDSKKVSKNGKDIKLEKAEKSERVDKSDIKKDGKSSSNKGNILKKEKLDIKDSKKDSRSDPQLKDKKRRDEKKSKSKDDHSSLRKNSNDRRSTDRDGSNGSNGSKGSQSSSLSTGSAVSKSAPSNLKESNHVGNSSSGDTSDSVEEKTIQLNRSKLTEVENTEKVELESINNFVLEDSFVSISQESSSSDNSLSSRKRPMQNEEKASNEVKIKKPKFAKNFQEAKKLMKIRKQMEKQKQKQYEDKRLPDTKKTEPKREIVTQSNTSNDVGMVPDEERVQIIEIPDEEYEEPYPDRQTNLTLEERSMILLEGELGTSNLLQKQSRVTATLSDMELCIKQSLDETICHKKPIESQDYKTIEENDATSCVVRKESQDFVGEQITLDTENQKAELTDQCSKTVTETLKVQLIKKETQDNNEIEKNNDGIEQNCFNNSSMEEDINNTHEVARSIFSENSVKEYKNTNTQLSKADSPENSDHEDCRYFNFDNEKSDKFTNFLNSLETGENNSLEDIIKSLGGQVVSSAPKNMAPPMVKRKNSASPLTDILFNNSDNNNDKATVAGVANNDSSINNTKKRKLIGSKPQRYPINACVSQNMLNGENFVMPLSPESDVSATSEKIPSSHVAKEDKSRHRSSQRYSSDDLYKPRPLFSSSSRRSRRSNQA